MNLILILTLSSRSDDVTPLLVPRACGHSCRTERRILPEKKEQE